MRKQEEKKREQRMLITATQKNSRQTPRKIRLVADAVKGMKLADAIKQLGVIERRGSLVVLKVMRQAIANAVHNHGFSFDQLSLKNIRVTEGQRYKRFRAVSRGRAHTVVKRTCHVVVELEAGKQAPAPVVESKTEVVKEVKKASKPAKSKVEKKVVGKTPAKKTKTESKK